MNIIELTNILVLLSKLVWHEGEEGHVWDAGDPQGGDTQAEGGSDHEGPLGGSRHHQEGVCQEAVRDYEGEEEEQTGGERRGETEASELLQKSNRQVFYTKNPRNLELTYTVSVTLYVSGLRKAKVPLMVYSCGGFSRCFRIARFYDLEGPPVGVEYERPESERKALNPEL